MCQLSNKRVHKNRQIKTANYNFTEMKHSVVAYYISFIYSMSPFNNLSCNVSLMYLSLQTLLLVYTVIELV